MAPLAEAQRLCKCNSQKWKLYYMRRIQTDMSDKTETMQVIAAVIIDMGSARKKGEKILEFAVTHGLILILAITYLH